MLDGEQLYFDQTGQIMSGPFLSAWEVHGGMNGTGNPVSGPVQQGDRWIQWFEYARLEIINVPVTEATEADVQRAPIGLIYAERFGYTSFHPAFQPVEQGGEGARYFEETGHSVANGFLAFYESGSNAGYLGQPISQEFTLNDATYQFFQYGAITWSEGEASIVAIGTLDAMLNGTLTQPQPQPEGVEVYSPPTGAGNARYPGERWIDINLSTYTLTAYEGDQPVLSSAVVTGAEATPTVTGEFAIYMKYDLQDMEGPNVDGSEYFQEDVPWVMYFYQDWAVHGSYWRYSFGYAASHGCVNLPVETAAVLYQWASYGTRVSVHY